jgi:AcrR family transcriptional regulator
LADGALKRSKTENLIAIVAKQELQKAVAKAADAVIQNQVGAGGPLRFRMNHVLILMNMFTKNVKPRKRGRPPGQSAQGAAARDRLYETAIRMINERGYEATTLREIAKEANVSVGLLYRYFPSKQAVIIALYEELSRDFSRQAAAMNPGKWRDRFLFALQTSLRALHPHRTTLRALMPVLIADPEDGVFAEGTAFSRVRVQQVFEDAVEGATDAPKAPVAGALGRLLYLLHLAVLLWWLIDKTPRQRATAALVALTEQMLPPAALTLRLPPIRRFVLTMDELIREGLIGNPAAV